MSIPGDQVARIMAALTQTLEGADTDALNAGGLAMKTAMLDAIRSRNPLGFPQHKGGYQGSAATAQQPYVRYTVHDNSPKTSRVTVWAVPTNPYLVEFGQQRYPNGIPPRPWFDQTVSGEAPVILRNMANDYIAALERSLR